ncbi:MAG: ATP-binding protein [Bacteroidota bacterium]|nr:ATP-binding protein [Bacteroidota bacterium]
MIKDILKKIILEYQEFVTGIKLIPRKYNIESLASYIIVGPRRSGKTYFLYQIIQDMIRKGRKQEDILYINFEDERLMELKFTDLDTIVEVYKELYTRRPVFFFDEIQNVEGWEKFLRRLADQKYRIYVSGSNAKLLSKEMASVLGGRFLILEMHNLSFREYLFFNKVALEDNFEYTEQRFDIIAQFREYLEYGAFPEVINFKNKKAYLSNLFQKVFYGDVMSRHRIRNEYGLKLMIKKIAESTTDETSFTRIRNLIKAAGVDIGTATLIEYFNYLEEGFLAYSLQNFALKFAERETKKKFYFVDTGFLNLFLFEYDDKLLENLVFLELKRRYGDDIFYFREKLETDFYLPQQEQAIQVSYSLSRQESLKRELLGLKATLKSRNLKEGIILTYNEEKKITQDGFKIQIIPVWKWMLKYGG